MSYITREMTVRAIERMKGFHDSLEQLHKVNDLNFFQDLGRRNILMSRPQEVFFCNEIKTKFSSACSDGRTGQPDILVPELGKELECKITTKRKGGSWSFQADYATLEKKGSCDFLYVCCDAKFEEFAVFYFNNLDTSNFKPPAPGSRGKSKLSFHSSFHKCTPLVGNIEGVHPTFLAAAEEKLKNSKSKSEKLRAEKSIDFWKKNPRYSITLEKI